MPVVRQLLPHPDGAVLPLESSILKRLGWTLDEELSFEVKDGAILIRSQRVTAEREKAIADFVAAVGDRFELEAWQRADLTKLLRDRKQAAEMSFAPYQSPVATIFGYRLPQTLLDQYLALSRM